MKISKVKNGLIVTASGPLVVSYIGTGEVLLEQVPQGDTPAPARTETRGRKKKEPAADVQPGTMFTPPAE